MITDNKKYVVQGNTVLAPQKHVDKRKHVEKHKYEKLKKSQKETLKNQKQKELKKKASVLMHILASFVIGLLIVGRYGIIYNNQNEIKNTVASIETGRKDTENLKVQFIKYNNIKYIEEVATKKLHMVKPNISDVYYCDLSKNDFDDLQNEKKNQKQSMMERIKKMLF